MTATASDAPDAPAVTGSIGPYRLIREIGRGGMGVVYLAVREDGAFRRRVAIKLLKRGMDTDHVLRRFEFERQVLAALNHPGIARVHDVGETSDRLPYFVMEYVEGLNIVEYCDVHRLRILERLALFQKVCVAVHYAHQNLVVHRDLKPGNILVTNEGEPKLLDFGIAKIVNPDMALIAGDPTAPELRLMTPAYASPEQVRGGPITTASDIYSLGVLLYELVSGHRPYRLRTRIREELERIICFEEPEKPSTAISRIEQADSDDPTTTTVPAASATLTPESVSSTREGRPDRLRKRLAGDVDNIVLMAMRKEPQRRYRSAEQMAEDISRHRDGRPVIAHPDKLTYRMQKFMRRNRAAVGAAAAILLTLILGITGTTLGWAAADAGWSAAEMRRREAELQRGIAEAQRDRADARFEQVRQLARIFMVDFHDAIQELDGSIPAREMLVTTALSYLDALAEEAGDDDDLKRELASAYERVGDIRGGYRNPSLGDTEGALQNYRTALKMRRVIAQRHPDVPEVQQELAVGLTRVADMLLVQGDVDAALDMHRSSLEIWQAQIEAGRRDMNRRREFAVALANVGAAHMTRGESARALEYYERSLELRRELADEHPEDTRLQRGVSVACLRVGGRFEDAGLHEPALRFYQEAVDIRRRLSESNPTSSRWARDLAVARYFAGRALLAMDRSEEALEHLNAYLAVTSRRAHDNPQDARALRDLAAAHEIVGGAYAEMSDWSAALEHYRSFQAMVSPLAHADSTNAQYAMLLAVSHERLGDALSAIEQHDAACEEGRRMVEVIDRLVETSDDVRTKAVAARLHLKLGGWLREAGQRGESLRHLTDARSRFEQLAEARSNDSSSTAPSRPLERAGIVESLSALATLMIDIGDGGEALRYANDAIAAAAEDAGPRLLRTLAAAQHLSGNTDEAITTVQRALGLLADVAVDDANALRALLEADLSRFQGDS